MQRRPAFLASKCIRMRQNPALAIATAMKRPQVLRTVIPKQPDGRVVSVPTPMVPTVRPFWVGARTLTIGELDVAVPQVAVALVELPHIAAGLRYGFIKVSGKL